MGIIRPATPGFIVTLVATALLAVVSFCVPYFKSVFFLKASISVDGHSGNITFGTLGYCLELPSNTTCSKPSVGYELDINSLVGNNFPVQIPQVAVKWLTYALVLHIVALAGAGVSAVFGLLAHVREMSMTCCSTFVSGFAAVVAMFAFIFDLILFFVAKSRINDVGSAQIGNAIWLTLAAWLLLFFSGCFYTLGRCCISSRPRVPGKSSGWNRDAEAGNGVGAGPDKYAEQMRLDAVKAEADRKARQKQASETGLPAFYENQPLTGHVDGDQVYLDNDHDHDSQTAIAGAAAPMAGRAQGHSSGYVQGVPGSRTIDDYYAGPSQAQTPSSNTYPPQRERSEYAPSMYSNNTRSPRPQQSMPGQDNYGASPYAAYNNVGAIPAQSSATLAVPGQYPQEREYGHAAGGSSYHTAVGHDQQASAYSQYDPYGAQPLAYEPYGAQPQSQQQSRYAEPSSYHDPYGTNNAYGAAPVQPNPYLSPPSTSPPLPQHDCAYTLGGDGYGSNSVPPLPDHTSSPGGFGYSQPPLTQSPPPINTNMGYSQPPLRSPVGGPRVQPGTSPEDAPPGYEPGTSGITGNWGKR